MQAFDNKWAWVFNIGVQVFLLLSGYLYGHKTVSNRKQWLYKRAERIYVPFIVFIIAVIPAYALTDMISWKHIVVYIADMQGIMGGVKGLGHLWFLTAIAICYIITPLLQWSRRYSRLLLWVVIVILITVELLIPEYGFKASWVELYAIGYYLANCNKWDKLSLGGVCLIGLALSIPNCTWDLIRSNSQVNNLVMHDSGAVLIVLLFLALFTRLDHIKVPKVIQVFDKYSFQIYIVHHVLIMPPFGLLGITDYVVLNVLIIIVYIIFAAWALTLVSDKVIERTRELLKIYVRIK